MKPEQQLSRAVRTAVSVYGGAVYSTEQGYRHERGGTRTTPGIPDLIVFGPGKRWAFVELKVGKRKLTAAQQRFEEYCTESDVPFLVWRTADDAIAWLNTAKAAEDGDRKGGAPT